MKISQTNNNQGNVNNAVSEDGDVNQIKPPYPSCPWPGCTFQPRLSNGKWWEYSSGQPHFMWGLDT